MKKILAFGASNSKNSINKTLAHYTAKLFEDFEITLADLNDYELPLFSVDLEKEIGHPKAAVNFSKLLESNDGLIISLAEHNSNVSAAFKNLEDWVSRLEGPTWKNKNTFLLSTSNGKRGGASVMNIALSIFPYRGATIIAHFSLPSYSQNFSIEKGIIQPELKLQYLEQLNKFKASLLEK